MTILIVDDFAPVRNSLKRLLSSIHGIDLMAEAADGYEAQEMIRTLKPDVLILDIQMPVKSGMDLLKECAGNLEGTTVIVLTAYTTPELRQQCLTLGAEYVLDKAMEFQRVPEIITKVARAKWDTSR